MAYSRDDYLEDFCAVHEEMIQQGLLNAQEVAMIRNLLHIPAVHEEDQAA